jgi:hypothetical protein
MCIFQQHPTGRARREDSGRKLLVHLVVFREARSFSIVLVLVVVVVFRFFCRAAIKVDNEHEHERENNRGLRWVFCPLR